MGQPDSEQYLVDAQGDRKAVVLPLPVYKGMLEDLHDLAVVAERRDEETVPLEDVVKKLKANGLLSR